MTGVGYDLPVVVERMTFCQGGYDDGDEGERKEGIEDEGPSPIEFCPTLTDDLLYELKNGDFGGPDVDGVPDASAQDQTTSDGTVVDVFFSQAVGLDVVGPP